MPLLIRGGKLSLKRAYCPWPPVIILTSPEKVPPRIVIFRRPPSASSHPSIADCDVRLTQCDRTCAFRPSESQ